VKINKLDYEMRQNQKRKFSSVINANSLEEKEVFVTPCEQLTNLQPGPSCKPRRIRVAKEKGIGKLSGVIKI